MTFDGKHGVIADSLSVSWQTVRDALPSDPDAVARFSGPRVQPPVDDHLRKGHGWTLYECIDRTQLWADNALTVRALQVDCLGLQFGRGRVFDAPYGPEVNCEQVTFRAPAAFAANNNTCRNRVTSFRSTVADSNVRAIAREVINDPTRPPVYALDNYRAFIVEGFPIVQRVPDYFFCSSRAELDVPITSGGFAPFCTPVPDYAVGLRIDNPKAAYQTTTDLCIAWVDVFGTRFPASAATYTQGPFVSDVTSQLLTVPAWASACHLYNGNPLAPGPGLDFPILGTWELLL